MLVFAESFLTSENTGVKARVFEGDRTQIGQPRTQALRIVVEALHPPAENRQHSKDIVLVNQRGDQNGVQIGIVGQVSQAAEFCRLNVGKFRLAAGVHRYSDQTGIGSHLAFRSRGCHWRMKGYTTHGIMRIVVQIEGTTVTGQHLAGIAREGIEEFLGLEFADQGLADGDQ